MSDDLIVAGQPNANGPANGAPHVMYGRLLEAAHVSVYTFERLCDELDWLLEGDRWQTVGGGFKDINDFIRSIDLSTFNLGEKRKKLHQRIKELQPEASTRAIGEMTGTHHSTVARHVANATESDGDDGSGPAIPDGPVANPTPAPVNQSGHDAARSAKKTANATQRKADNAARKQEEDEALAATVLPGSTDQDITHEDFRECGKRLADGLVDLVFTDPPYDRDSLPLYADLAALAKRVLKDGGSLVCYLGQYQIDEVCRRVTPHLRLWWTLGCYHTGDCARMKEYGVVVRWKPMLWFVKGTRGDKRRFLDDLVVSEQQKDAHPWQQGEAEAAYYIEKLTRPGGLVFDPFCGGGTTALAAKKLKRNWLSCDTDAAAVARARGRLRDAG